MRETIRIPGAGRTTAAAILALIVLALVAATILTRPVGAQESSAAPEASQLTELTVVGTGSRNVNYDGAVGRFTVSVLRDSLIAAVSDGNKALQAIADEVEAKCTETEPENADHTAAPTCISPTGLQTVSIRVAEEYDWTEQGRVSIGFRYDNHLKIAINGTGFAGGLVDMVIAAGGDAVRFDNLNFTVSRRLEFERLAMLDAIDDARTTAQTMADHMGYRIVRIVRVTPDDFYDPYGDDFGAFRLTADTAAEESDAAPTPVFGGAEVVTSRVHMVFELQPVLGIGT